SWTTSSPAKYEARRFLGSLHRESWARAAARRDLTSGALVPERKNCGSGVSVIVGWGAPGNSRPPRAIQQGGSGSPGGSANSSRGLRGQAQQGHAATRTATATRP